MLFSSSEFISEKEDTERNKITKDFTSALDSTERGKQSDLKGYPQEHRTSNYSQFYEEESLQQEAYVVSSEKYRNAQTQYINNAKNNSEQNNKKEVPYKQNNLNDTHVSSATPTINKRANFLLITIRIEALLLQKLILINFQKKPWKKPDQLWFLKFLMKLQNMMYQPMV